jgi:hypothetical protein
LTRIPLPEYSERRKDLQVAEIVVGRRPCHKHLEAVDHAASNYNRKMIEEKG